MFAEKPGNRWGRSGIVFIVIVLLFSFTSLFAANTRELIAVLDLTSDGSLSLKSIQPICNKINDEIAKNTHYITFERKYLPFIIEPFQKNQTSPCNTDKCLSELGNQIGANQIVAGSITQNKGELTIQLNRIDVNNSRKVQSISNKMPLMGKNEFISKKIPGLVQELMSDKALSASADGKKSIFTSPITIWSGVSAIGLAGIAAAVILLPKKNNSAPPPGEGDLPLGNIPEHKR